MSWNLPHPIPDSSSPIPHPPSAIRHPQSGFTLLEVMLALSILAMMGLMVFGSMRSLVDATTRAESALDELHVVEAVTDRISGSLRAAAFFDNDAERYEFRQETGPGSPPKDTVSWVTSAPAFLLENPGGLRRVIFTVEEVEGVDALVMRSYSSLYDEEDPEVEEIENGDPTVISRRIKGLKIWMYDASEDQWVEEWERDRQLPLSVSLTFHVAPEESGGTLREVTRRVDIPVARLSFDTRRGRRRVDTGESEQTAAPPATSPPEGGR